MKNPFKLLSTREVYKNPWISVREDKVIRPGGKEGIFGVITMIPGSIVLPLTKDGYVYLAKEYRYAIKKLCREAISGGVNKGETALEAAKRELKEEAGFVAEKWTELSTVDPFTSIVESPNYIFIAEDLTKGEVNPDEGEVIELEKVLLDDALKMVMDGEITHSATCVAILKASILRK